MTDKKNIYCGIGKVPKNMRLGSKKESMEMGQVRYYGLRKIDPKTAAASTTPTEKTDNRENYY